MKVRSEYICQQCGYKTSGFLGKCPNCDSWNTLVETVTRDQRSITSEGIKPDLVRLSEVKKEQLNRSSTGYSEFDRVLGGGIVPGSIVLVAGDPGIGKSTLLLQVAMSIATGQLGDWANGQLGSKKPKSQKAKKPNNQTVLYVTGEESAQQVKIRADRIAKTADSLYVLPQTDVNGVVAAASSLNPKLLIVDSIQTLTTDALSGSAGSVGQVRECAQILQRFAKTSGVPIFIVGHVTKEGSIAGPRVLEHLVDAVLNLEGDPIHAYRLLRATKNRFGSTFEVGVFEMTDAGMIEVANPSQIFLAQRIAKRPGSVVCATVAGGRPLLCEVQALTTTTIFGLPTRRVTGLDFQRVQIVIAAVSRAANLALSNLDIYVNVAGGLKISEPAADLAAALAIVSAAVDKPIEADICAFGEVGLLGELRPVANLKSRLSEAKRLGFSRIVSSFEFKTLEEAIGFAVHGG